MLLALLGFAAIAALVALVPAGPEAAPVLVFERSKA